MPQKPIMWCFHHGIVCPMTAQVLAPEIVSRRIHAMRMMEVYKEKNTPFIVLTTASALRQKMRKPKIIQKASVLAAPKKKVEIDRLSRFLISNGYLRTGTVRETGEFAVRGGIVDIFPSGFDQPVRLDFFGNVIEKIKVFDPTTQMSLHEIESLDLSPVSEIILNEKTITQFRQNYRNLCGGTVHSGDVLYENVTKGHYTQGMEAFLPLFDPDLTHLLDVLPEADLYFDVYAEAASEEFIRDVQDYYNNRIAYGVAVPPEEMYVMPELFEQSCHNRIIRHFTPHSLPEGEVVIDLQAKPPHNFSTLRKTQGVNLFEETVKIVNLARDAGKQVFISCRSDGARERMIQTLCDHGLTGHINIKDFVSSYGSAKTMIGFCITDLPHGFANAEILFLTEDDIFGDKSARRRKKSKKADQFLLEAQGLAVGDLVVHSENGIGRYLGLKALEVNKILHDCILLEYHGGDKLYVPVENMDLLTRYGAEGSGGALDKLGSAAWQGRKARLKERINDIANSLIKTAAERSLRQGEIIHPIEDLYEDFRARFPYEETDDQMSAIESVIEDLGSGKPMDRLVCGDVGFGKTEVAMRAAFCAAACGMQTAIIVPTTLLVRQHYKNFIARFEGQPFKIGRLSRMVSSKEASETREALEKGTMDIVIGTHALLSAKVKFKNLALLIVDEEQHFGVTHKEKLKELKADLHVLTLTATPIPRTLQLSMTGVRDLSLIATPPIDRLAIRTYVMPFERETIREALLREKYRGGQAFFVVPRVNDIPEVVDFLQKYVQEVSFIVGHGQMPPTDLENVMNEFYDRKYDILIATTIVESGIDIPTANTMIIWRADMFGLAQLYQIRGRIGRSKLRAYAYLTTEPKKTLSETAQRRLKVLESLDSLGAGFTLASHDMDIRGAGNLLGDEQSGHIKEVGFELYQQMLEEALANLRVGDKEIDLGKSNKSPQINIGLSAIIPETYVADLAVRMGLYRRLAEIETRRECDDFAGELIDRFGKIPREVDNLLKIIEIKNACKKAGVSKCDAGEKGMLFSFHNDYFPKPEALIEFIASQKDKVKLRADHRLAVSVDMPSVSERFKKVLQFLDEIIALKS